MKNTHFIMEACVIAAVMTWTSYIYVHCCNVEEK